MATYHPKDYQKDYHFVEVLLILTDSRTRLFAALQTSPRYWASTSCVAVIVVVGLGLRLNSQSLFAIDSHLAVIAATQTVT